MEIMSDNPDTTRRSSSSKQSVDVGTKAVPFWRTI